MPGTGGRPGCSWCSPGRRGRSRRGRPRPRGGTACRRRWCRRSPARRAGRRPRSRRSRCTARRSRPRRTGGPSGPSSALSGVACAAAYCRARAVAAPTLAASLRSGRARAARGRGLPAPGRAHGLWRPIAEVVAPDAWYLKRGLTARRSRAGGPGRPVLHRRPPAGQAAPARHRRRRPGARAALRDERPPGRRRRPGRRGPAVLVQRCADARYDRFAVRFADGGALVMRDPRRLGGVELDPSEDRLGPDALTVTPAGLRKALAGSTAPLKARLLDQARLAGVGNLIADEVLWRAGLSPLRPAGSLTEPSCAGCTATCGRRSTDFLERGGRTPASSWPSAIPAATAPRTGRRCRGRRSAPAPRTGARPTSTEPGWRYPAAARDSL